MLLLLPAVAAIGVPAARACTCAAEAGALQVGRVDAVLVGRITRLGRLGEAIVDPIEIAVFDTLKGTSAPKRVLRRGPCRMVPGDVGDGVFALVREGRVFYCDGNVPLEQQLAHGLAGHMAALGGTAVADVPLLERFVREALGSRLRGHRAVPVVYPPLTGRLGRAGNTALRFVHAVRPGEHAVTVTTVQRAGRVTLVEANMGARVRSAGLFGTRDEGLEVFAATSWDRPIPQAYACRKDADCVATCAAGAVSRAFVKAHGAEMAPCDGGCGVPGERVIRCDDGACALYRGDVLDESCFLRRPTWR